MNSLKFPYSGQEKSKGNDGEKKSNKQRPPSRKSTTVHRNRVFDVSKELGKAAHCYRDGQLRRAQRICQKILNIDPTQTSAWNFLGAIAHQTGSFDEAVGNFEKAMKNDPGNPMHYNNLGYSLISKGKFQQGIDFCRQALNFSPDLAQAHNNMGLGMLGLGRLPEAISCFRAAVRLMPSNAKACNNMALALLRSGRSNEALIWSQKALSVQPDYAEAFNSLGLAHHAEGDLDKALESFKKAVRVKKDYLEGYQSLGMAYQDQGQLDEAATYFRKALELVPNPGIQVRLATLLPVIYGSNEDIEQARRSLTHGFELLRQDHVTLTDPYKEVGATNFLLVYQGLDDRKIQEDTASFYTEACPDLAASPSVKAPERSMGKKIHIGFISKHFFDHTIGALNLGIVENLSRKRFHVELFRFPGREDDVTRSFDKAADNVVVLPTDLPKARKEIAERSLDILFYLDIGMDPLTYFLAFSRLAPVQCVTWGHPVTTGVPNIDYFISLKSAEPDNGDDHYSERLIRLATPGTYFSRPAPPENPSSPSRFGLPDDRHLYMCPQSLFKFHPDMDDAFGAILRRDAKGLLVLIHGKNAHWSELLHRRLKRTMPDLIQRVTFLPRMGQKDFLSLLSTADAVLDTMHFGGGKTSLEAFACSTPVVTLPGEFLRGRLTLAFYRHMGIMDCVAQDHASYADIALRLAEDKRWRNDIKSKIGARSKVLFENIEVVHELERLFEKLVAEKSGF